MQPLYLTNPITKHRGSNHYNVQTLKRPDTWFLNIEKLVKLTGSPSKAVLRFMVPETQCNSNRFVIVFEVLFSYRL